MSSGYATASRHAATKPVLDDIKGHARVALCSKLLGCSPDGTLDTYLNRPRMPLEREMAGLATWLCWFRLLRLSDGNQMLAWPGFEMAAGAEEPSAAWDEGREERVGARPKQPPETAR